MSVILGLSGNYHDAAAALVIDGKIIAAIQEERISRIKNDPSLPFKSAQACLQFAGINIAEVDQIYFYESPFLKLERVLLDLMRNFPQSCFRFPATMESQLGHKIWVRDHISETLQCPRKQVSYVIHHKSHAASAFLPGPFAEAAVLVVDGIGEKHTTTIWSGSSQGLELLDAIEFPHSLGLLYAAITAFLGFQVNEGEYKVMGLSAYGDAYRYLGEFTKIIQIQSDGSFELNLRYFANFNDLTMAFGPELEKVFGPRRPYAKPWDLSTQEDRHYADIAAALQKITQQVMLGLAYRALRLANSENLCLAGGVALNVLSNAYIAQEIGRQNLFVQPAAGDAGGALGAALLGAFEQGDKLIETLNSAALGLGVDTALAVKMAKDLGFRYQRLNDPFGVSAGLLAKGKLLGLVHGRFEWGPRALGQRSLLANPANKEISNRLNRSIKKRELFRPFAPVVPASELSQYFQGEANFMTPFMTTVLPSKPNTHRKLPAITHIDGTARVQSVANSHILATLLDCFAEHTGEPILLNTSLNGAGEPIVASAQDALLFFSETPIDCLLIEDILITRNK
ncbi:MAG: carbamoyltransferase N-terminal domain-containing protein [Spirochaetota bacterium]